jgi:hypothetical protein
MLLAATAQNLRRIVKLLAAHYQRSLLNESKRKGRPQ